MTAEVVAPQKSEAVSAQKPSVGRVLISLGKWGARAVPVYLIACGCMYLWGYWRYFHVNFLEYITPGEVLARSFFDVFPVMVVIAEFVVIPLLIFKGTPLEQWLDRMGKRQLEKRIAKRKPMPWLLRHPTLYAVVTPLGFMMVGVIMFVVVPLTGGDFADTVVFVMPLLFGGLFGLFLETLGPKFLANGTGTFVVVMVLFGPTASYMHGEITAERRKFESPDLTTVTIAHVAKDAESLMPEGYVYAGRMGGFVFLASKKYVETVAVPERQVTGIETYERKTQAESKSAPARGP